MPRKGFVKDARGGQRELAHGDNSATRTDLNQHLPATAAPDQPYGDKARDIAAQRAVPLVSAASPPSQPPATPAAALAEPEPEPRATPAPGSLLFDHPTQRPNEPITAGMPFGPGPGPEALGAPPSVSDQLAALAASPNASATLQNLAAAARSLGY